MSLTVIHDGLGRDSRTIACLLAERRLLLDGALVGPEAVHAAVFADTGAEWPHTYALLPRVRAQWEAMGIPFFHLRKPRLVACDPPPALDRTPQSISGAAMGIAAYNRGNALISKQLRLSPVEQLAKDLDDLNTLPKNAKAVRPWGPCEIVPGHGGWWVACPHTGYGYWYKTLRRAVADYRVVIVGVEIRNGEICYRAVPA